MKVSQHLLWRLWLPFTLAAAWELSSRAGLLSALFFPPPSALFVFGVALLRSGELTEQIKITVLRTVGGAGLGIAAGIACGLLMGISAAVRRSTEPLVSALVAAPKLSLLPLLMLFLGIGESPRVVLIAATAFVMAALHTLDGVRDLDLSYVELARNYGAHSWRLVRWVYLPACLPHVFTGIRLALGRALAVCIALEIIGSQAGLGQMIWAGWESFKPEYIYIGVFSAAALGVLFHASMRVVEKAVVPWKS